MSYIAYKDYVPTSVTLNTGTSSSDVADLQYMFDGDTYDIAEVTGVPGFDLEINFTNVMHAPVMVIARWQYDGSSSHYVTIDMWNYEDSAWDEIRVFSDSALYFDSMTMYIPLYNQANYINSSNQAKLRFYHVTSGNAAHDIHIDYIGLMHSGGV